MAAVRRRKNHRSSFISASPTAKVLFLLSTPPPLENSHVLPIPPPFLLPPTRAEENRGCSIGWVVRREIPPLPRSQQRDSALPLAW